MLYTICYISSSRENIYPFDLNALFSQVKTTNDELDITGVLIYDQGNFFQVLEGKTATIVRMYGKIIRDVRHHYIIKLIESTIQDRMFDGYKTGFEVISTTEKKDKLNNYVKWLKQAENKNVDKVIKIVENFLRRNTPS